MESTCCNSSKACSSNATNKRTPLAHRSAKKGCSILHVGVAEKQTHLKTMCNNPQEPGPNGMKPFTLTKCAEGCIANYHMNV